MHIGAQIALFSLPEKTTIKSERAFILSQFVEEINKERENTKWKKVTGRAVAIKTSHISLHDLKYFYSTCKDYKNRHGSFSKGFFGALKLR